MLGIKVLIAAVVFLVGSFLVAQLDRYFDAHYMAFISEKWGGSK